jgi:hypothetical protein
LPLTTAFTSLPSSSSSSHNSVRPPTQVFSSSYDSMTISELQQIAYQMGYDSKGLDRVDLVMIAQGWGSTVKGARTVQDAHELKNQAARLQAERNANIQAQIQAAAKYQPRGSEALRGRSSVFGSARNGSNFGDMTISELQRVAHEMGYVPQGLDRADLIMIAKGFGSSVRAARTLENQTQFENEARRMKAERDRLALEEAEERRRSNYAGMNIVQLRQVVLERGYDPEGVSRDGMIMIAKGRGDAVRTARKLQYTTAPPNTNTGYGTQSTSGAGAIPPPVPVVPQQAPPNTGYTPAQSATPAFPQQAPPNTGYTPGQPATPPAAQQAPPNTGYTPAQSATPAFPQQNQQAPPNTGYTPGQPATPSAPQQAPPNTGYTPGQPATPAFPQQAQQAPPNTGYTPGQPATPAFSQQTQSVEQAQAAVDAVAQWQTKEDARNRAHEEAARNIGLDFDTMSMDQLAKRANEMGYDARGVDHTGLIMIAKGWGSSVRGARRLDTQIETPPTIAANSAEHAQQWQAQEIARNRAHEEAARNIGPDYDQMSMDQLRQLANERGYDGKGVDRTGLIMIAKGWGSSVRGARALQLQR